MATARLRILETTDLHMSLQAQKRPPRGLALLVSDISKLRSEGVETLLFDNGDLLQGGPLGDHLMSEPANGVHPAVDALNALKYDAVTLGNHEFNYPLWRTIAALAGFEMPVVSANIRCGNLAMLTRPWAILNRDLTCSDGQTRSVRIGVIGFVTPQIVDWDHAHLHGKVQTDDIVAAALTHTPAMKRAGADIIVALAHSGIGEAQHRDRMENAVVPLAALSAIDVVLAGHTHDVFPGSDIAATDDVDPVAGTVHGKPTVKAGFNGSHLGVVDLELQHDSKAGWKIAGHTVRVIAAGSTGGSTDKALAARLDRTLAAPLAATQERLEEPLAKLTEPMSSHFTMLGFDPTLMLLAEAQREAAEPFLIQSPFANLPVAVAVSSFVAGGRAGPENFLNVGTKLTRADVAALCPFNNTQCVVLRRGWQVRQWLERCAAFFQQINPGETDQELVNRQFPAYRFDRLIGFDYGYDLSRPAINGLAAGTGSTKSGRLTHLRHLGRDIADDALVAIVTNSFRARTGGPSHISADDIVHTSATDIATILTDHVAGQGLVSPNWAAQFSLAPIKGATAHFDTSPSAKTPPDAYETRPRGLTEAGFMRYQIAF